VQCGPQAAPALPANGACACRQRSRVGRGGVLHAAQRTVRSAPRKQLAAASYSGPACAVLPERRAMAQHRAVAAFARSAPDCSAAAHRADRSRHRHRGGRPRPRPAAPPVGDVMTTESVTVRESDSVRGVLAAMRHEGVRHTPVTDSKGVLLGVITLDDVLGVVSARAGRGDRKRAAARAAGAALRALTADSAFRGSASARTRLHA
jgi:CBS-domain-containing membrane protein